MPLYNIICRDCEKDYESDAQEHVCPHCGSKKFYMSKDEKFIVSHVNAYHDRKISKATLIDTISMRVYSYIYKFYGKRWLPRGAKYFIHRDDIVHSTFCRMIDKMLQERIEVFYPLLDVYVLSTVQNGVWNIEARQSELHEEVVREDFFPKKLSLHKDDLDFLRKVYNLGYLSINDRKQLICQWLKSNNLNEFEEQVNGRK